MKLQVQLLLVLAGLLAGEAFFWLSRTVSTVSVLLPQDDLSRDSTIIQAVRGTQDGPIWLIPPSDIAAVDMLNRATQGKRDATRTLEANNYPFFQAPSPLHSQPQQNMSCFPPTGTNNDEDYVDVRCGVLIDALSLTAFEQYDMSDQNGTTSVRYATFLRAVVHDLMVQSSGHLPFFHLFPRVLLVKDVLATGETLLATGNKSSDVSVVVRQYSDIASLRGIVATLELKAKSRVVLLLRTATEPKVSLSPFDVASLSPFERTLYFNASVAFPARRRHSPPTLLFPLLDYYDVLFTTIPFFEEVLLGLNHNRDKYASLTELPTQIFSNAPYVGSDLFHAGFFMYRRSKATSVYFSSCAKAFHSNKQSLDKAFAGEMQHTLIPLALVMHSVFTATFAARDDNGEQQQDRITYATVDPIHCADWRWGPDLCHRYPSRAGKKKFERLETFRCDYFR